MKNLTPREIVSELDKYIVGQADAKRAVAVAVRNRWRRQQLPEQMRQDVSPKNILMIGPTGVGKTEIARRLANLTGAPFIKVEATKYTEVGYHGRDVESMIRDLLDSSISMVRGEMTEAVKAPAEEHVEERLLDYLLPKGEGGSSWEDDEAKARHERTREKLREQLRAGELEDRQIEIGVEEQATVVGVLGRAGMEMDVEMQSMFEKMLPSKRETKRLTVSEARKMLFGQEAEKLLDRDKVNRTAIDRVEQSGIVFLDEIDKVAGPKSEHGPDVSRQGVQRDLLPIVEGSTVMTKYGPVKTDHILFIAAGAFHMSKPSDLMPELQGRFPIRVELKDLTKEDFARILREPQNALTTQQAALLGTEGVNVEFSDDAIDAMAQIAFDINRRDQNIGARRLYTIMERVFELISFDAPELPDKTVKITGDFVRDRLKDVVKDEDLSKFIL
ncbi:MAG TPA: ATP-dependent protease ATPase subunit HslU [Tepidisphaeraceae bacterium]|jgi:ATP-dependent HslUV protease ATP-binding subunit HslU|nr:ATP-dependent protease ATPase subunit HslU [Tepidisphaeraceae bacterium]